MLILVTAPGGANSEQARKVGTDLVDRLQKLAAGIQRVLAVDRAATALPAGRRSGEQATASPGLIVVNLKGGENNAQNNAQTLSDQFVHDRDGVTVAAGGAAMQYAQINKQNQADLLLMEMIALPLSFLVLVWVFGGLLAAALPMALGALAVVGSMSVLRLITFTTEVSIFALNLSTALGLALAIDYTLLIISRYRDELAEGSDRDEALIRTMATAGRTVLFSAVTVALSMSATVAVPDVLPQVVRLRRRGHRRLRRGRLDRGHPGRDRAAGPPAGRAGRAPAGAADTAARPDPVHKPVEQLFWYRSTKFVMRRWAPIGLAVVALLLLLGLSVPPREVGLPRRPGAAAVGVVASGR